MIDAVQETIEQDPEIQPISLPEIPAFVNQHLGECGCTIQKKMDMAGEAIDVLNVMASRCVTPSSSIRGESEAVNAANFLRELAGKLLASADDLLSAEGYSTDFEFYPLNPVCRSVGVDGLDDEISFHVANVNSDEEAITRVHQAFSLLSSKSRRKIRRDHARQPSEPVSGIELYSSPFSEHRFRIGGDYFCEIDICVWNQECEEDAEELAHEFIEHLQNQARTQAEPARLTA